MQCERQEFKVFVEVYSFVHERTLVFRDFVSPSFMVRYI